MISKYFLKFILLLYLTTIRFIVWMRSAMGHVCQVNVFFSKSEIIFV